MQAQPDRANEGVSQELHGETSRDDPPQQAVAVAIAFGLEYEQSPGGAKLGKTPNGKENGARVDVGVNESTEEGDEADELSIDRADA